MSREIPFFELFAQLQLSPELRLKLLGAVVVSACIQRESLSMELALTVRHPLEPADLDEMNAAIRRGYGLNDVKIRLTLKEEQPPSQRRLRRNRRRRRPTGPVLWGIPQGQAVERKRWI